MANDPRLPFPVTTERRQGDRLADHERRLAALERGRPTILVQPGAPAGAAREGAAIGSSTTPRLWLMVAGTWRYTTLT